MKNALYNYKAQSYAALLGVVFINEILKAPW
jgi:hypothetical protein